jgi:hypothetical protein
MKIEIKVASSFNILRGVQTIDLKFGAPDNPSILIELLPEDAAKLGLEVLHTLITDPRYVQMVKSSPLTGAIKKELQ